jgi:signal transduction histidine kinase
MLVLLDVAASALPSRDGPGAIEGGGAARERDRAHGDAPRGDIDAHDASSDQAISALRLCSDRLWQAREPREAIVAALAAMEEVLASQGVLEAGLIELSPEARTVRCTVLLRAGELQELAAGPLDRDWSIDEPPIDAPWKRIGAGGPFVWGLTSDPTVLIAEVRALHEASGARAVGYVPLVRAGETVGWIGLSFREAVPPSEQQVSLVRALASQVLFAIELERIARQSQAIALAQERQTAAQERAAQHARAADALSKTVAALRAAEDFDGFLPKVLHILASTFGAVSCALYETEGNTVYLRHWYVDSTVLGPEQMLQLDPERWSLIRLLAMGFTVPAEYLDGQSVSERSRPVVIDHRAGTARPDFDAFARANGWDLELNTPILVAGKAVGALCIYRGVAARYTPAEISLAETLSAQLALALEARRLSMKARERAVEIARLEEAEAALVRQLAQEAKANAALQEMVDAVSSLPTLDELIPVALGVVSRTFGVGDCGFFDVLPDQPIRVRFWQHHGRLLRPEELTQVFVHHPHVAEALRVGFAVDDAYFGEPNRDRTRSCFVDHQKGTSVPDFDAWALDNGFGAELNVPLVANGRMSGALVIYRPAGETFAPEEVALVERLGKQLALAVATARLAEEAREAAVARAREAEAVRHAAELQTANTALRKAIEGMSRLEDVGSFLDVLLAASIEVSGAHSGAIAVLTPAGIDHVVLYDPAGRVPRTRAMAEGTAIIPITPAIESMLRDIVSHPASWFIPVDREPNPDSFIAFHQRNGTRSIRIIPMLAGPRLIEYLGLGFPASDPEGGRQIALLRLLADQATTGVELARLADLAKHAAIAEERTRLAGDIHDSLAQAFTSIALQAEVAIAEVAPESPLRELLTLVEETARLGLAEARSSALALRPVAEGVGDLESTLASLASRCSVPGLLRCTYFAPAPVGVVSADVREAILRVAQEATANVLRHAKAQHVEIRYELHEGRVRLTIQDDGHGMPRSSASGRAGFGLVSMEARARALGGSLLVEPGAGGRGTCVRFTVAADAVAERPHA